MIRRGLSALGGISLALLLFWLLALLVAPPEEEIEVMEMTMPLSLADVVEAPAEPAPAAAPPEPPAEAPPSPEPPPLPDSALSLPEPELPTLEPEVPTLDASLPELSEVVPEPEPRPEPESRPVPAPPAEPAPAQAPSAETASEASSAAPVGRDGTPDEAASDPGPVDVGAATPTHRVPPDYPARAQRRGLEGHVELEFVIRPDGRVDPSSIRVTDARPRNVFDEAARQAVARWRFEPTDRLRRARQRLEFQLR